MANEKLKNAQLEDLARRDPRKIIESMFYIVDKSGNQQPFLFNPIQDKFYEDRTARDDVLKARKHGISSEVLAMFTTSFLFIPNTMCVCVSHTEKDTKILLDKVYYFIDNLPFKVTLAKSSAGWLRIDEMNTDFIIGTAGSKSFGRGSTIHKLHLSEFAFYSNPAMMTGLMNAVPDDLNNTWIVKETTANGYGNMHHKEWIEEKNGNSVFKPHFYSWFDNPEYKMDITEGTEFSEKERLIQDKYNLTDEQLKWRQWKISSIQTPDGYTKEDMFMQEFPSSDTEAFLATGRPVFDPKTLDWYETALCIDVLDKGELFGWNPPTFQVQENGMLKIYEKPISGHTYVIGGDVAEDGDYSALVVLDRATAQEVALWHGHLDEFEFAQTAYRLGGYYNDALIGIERNNMGVAVVMKLDELGYVNQYRTETIDEIGRKVKDKLGWETTGATRPILISDLNQVLSEHSLIVRSREIIGELKSFVRDKRGKPQAQVGTHDDLVMALGIAYQMYKTIPYIEEKNEVTVRKYRPNTTLYNFSSKKR